MVTTIAAYGCYNRGEKGSTVKFHKFPSIKRADLRKKWTLAMKRKDFSPSASTRIYIVLYYTIICIHTQL